MQAIRRDVRRVGPIAGILAIVAGLGLWIAAIGTQRPDYVPSWAGWVVTIFAWFVIVLGVWIFFVCLRLRQSEGVPNVPPRQMTDAERAELLAFQKARDHAHRVEKMVAIGTDAKTLLAEQNALTRECEGLATQYPEWGGYLNPAIARDLTGPDGLLSTLALIESILNPETARRDPVDLIKWGEHILSLRGSRLPADFTRDASIWYRHAEVWLERNRQDLFDGMRRKAKRLSDDDEERAAQLIERTLPYLIKAVPKQ